MRNAVRRAQAGMKDATSGMTQVAFTLLAGDEPSKASRDLISKGFGGVRAALDGIARYARLLWTLPWPNTRH